MTQEHNPNTPSFNGKRQHSKMHEFYQMVAREINSGQEVLIATNYAGAGEIQHTLNKEYDCQSFWTPVIRQPALRPIYEVVDNEETITGWEQQPAVVIGYKFTKATFTS